MILHLALLTACGPTDDPSQESTPPGPDVDARREVAFPEARQRFRRCVAAKKRFEPCQSEYDAALEVARTEGERLDVGDIRRAACWPTQSDALKSTTNGGRIVFIVDQPSRQGNATEGFERARDAGLRVECLASEPVPDGCAALNEAWWDDFNCGQGSNFRGKVLLTDHDGQVFRVSLPIGLPDSGVEVYGAWIDNVNDGLERPGGSKPR